MEPWEDTAVEWQHYYSMKAKLIEIAEAEGGEMRWGRPNRWWDDATWRCPNEHVSKSVLRSEALGRDACLFAACRAPLALTFPEDRDGPLVAPRMAS